jgi:hypothetical protein
MGDFSFFADPGSVVLSPAYGGLGGKNNEKQPIRGGGKNPLEAINIVLRG